MKLEQMLGGPLLGLHMTTPLTFHKFCKELVSLSINVEYVRPHKQLPPIPIGSLRVLHLMRIDGAIPWTLFQAVGSQLDFACLKELTLEFIVDVEGRVSFPGFVYPVIFSALDILRVFHATSVYSDVFAHFVNNRLSKLIVMDDPSIFGQIDWRVLQNVKRLEVRHPTDEFYETKYSSTAVHQLFSQLSSVTEVNMIGKVYYPAPIDIKWFNLVSLELAVAITDKDTLANMLTQLPRLKKLHISCRSMDRNDSHLTAYPDEQNAPLRLQTLVDVEYDDGDESKTVSKTLLRFDFYSHRAFDEHGPLDFGLNFPV
ncbi:hypothetical protein FBU59_002673 [Linderina macrospora]|uniref:Uncharacterized protein n=1 Tax=Linderina macrospora TaxID=4868 RepID=A0ACC1JAD7_9FUNG|nr:hypothetical protein FBU59_002673 [Linderina macrospora]